VIDSGIGIAPENLQFVFEEFSQVESPLQRKHKGTGLGLPLCRKLAAFLGGSVELHSEVNRGSTFSLILPMQYTAPSADHLEGISK
jgi:signal transduction histidine kinase